MANVEDPQEDPRLRLGKFLRARRERLRPEDLGFPSAGRRRTPGLRREEVAVAAGLSATWYTYLEQGRGNEVSPGVLDSIARALRMSEDDRRYMYLLMYGHTPPTEPTPAPAPKPPKAAKPATADVPVEDLLRSVVAATDNYPYPVYLADHACNLLSWNYAVTEWYDDFGRMPPEERNFVRWMFGSARAREAFADWESVARDLVGRWRIDFAPEPTHTAARNLVDQFREEFSEFREWWDAHVVMDHRIGTRTFRRPGIGDCELMIIPLLTIYDNMPGILVHYPVK